MLFTSQFVTMVFSDGTTRTVQKTDRCWDDLQEAIKKDVSEAQLREITDPEAVLQRFTEGKLEIHVDSGQVFYDGEVLHSTLAKKLYDMYTGGYPIQPLVKFLERLQANPSHRAVTELYRFLEANLMPITDDGHFLAYKAVNAKYKDFHTGKMDNSIGQTVEMPRNQVCDDKDKTCSSGLHFAARSYAESFGYGGHLMILKIDPADVVSIPSDYNNTKGRCCRYQVIGEVPRRFSDADKKYATPVYYTETPDEDAEWDPEVCPNCGYESPDLPDFSYCPECGTGL